MPQITGDKPSNAKSDDAMIASDMELNDEESILGATLSFQASSTGENNELEDSALIQESNATEGLKAVKYVKTNLEEHMPNNKDLFQGKRGKYKASEILHNMRKTLLYSIDGREATKEYL